MAVHRDYAGGAEDHRAEGRVMQFVEDVAVGMLTTWLHMILAPYYIMTALLPSTRKHPESPPPHVAHQPAPDLGPNVIRLAGSLRRH